MGERPGPPVGAEDFLERMEEEWVARTERAAGLKRLYPAWAKAEIVLGLSAAAAGLKLLPGEGASGWAGGALMVLGLYLAMAGHRSHLYMALNRQTAYLLQMLARAAGRGEEREP